MYYHGYVWDLGGTLLDNYASSARAFADTLQACGRSAPYEEIYAALRVSTNHAVHAFASDVDGFREWYREREATTLTVPVLFDGAATVLSAIVAEGGQNFMVSHRDNQVLEILDAADIAQYFSVVVTADSGFPRKPAPDSIQHLLEVSALLPDQVVAVGDRPLDIEAAHRAGVDSILFSPGKPDSGPGQPDSSDAGVAGTTPTFTVARLTDVLVVHRRGAISGYPQM
jgi:phosphoglycolate phosphatase-like HAD superfamily hydrolase